MGYEDENELAAAKQKQSDNAITRRILNTQYGGFTREAAQLQDEADNYTYTKEIGGGNAPQIGNYDAEDLKTPHASNQSMPLPSNTGFFDNLFNGGNKGNSNPTDGMEFATLDLTGFDGANAMGGTVNRNDLLDRNVKYAISNVYKNYAYSREDVMQEARDINIATGIPVNAIMDSPENLSNARDLYRRIQEDNRLAEFNGSNDISIEKLIVKYPALKGVVGQLGEEDAARDVKAALALKNLKAVDETQGVFDAFASGWQTGMLSRERNAYGYELDNQKNAPNASQLNKLKEYDASIKAGQKEYPTLMRQIAGQAGENLPLMAYGLLKEFGVTTAISIGAAQLAKDMKMTAASVPLVLAAKQASTAAQVVNNLNRFKHTLGTLAMFEDMRQQLTGSHYLENMGKYDHETNQKLSFVQGNVESAIEVLSLKVAKNAVWPANAKEELAKIIAKSSTVEAAKEGAGAYVANAIKAFLVSTGSEMTEEGTQTFANMVIENAFLQAQGRTNERYSVQEILSQSISDTMDSFYACVGLGILGGAISVPGHAHNISNIRQLQNDYNMGIAQSVHQIQTIEAVRDNTPSMTALAQKDSTTQKALMDEQFKAEGMETTYLDVESIKNEPNGAMVLNQIAQENGTSQEELDIAMKENGMLEVKSSVLAKNSLEQADSDMLLKHATADIKVPTMARIKIENDLHKALLKELESKGEAANANLVKGIVDTLFKDDKQRDLAGAATLINPDNPYKGYQTLLKQYQDEEDAMLAPVLDTLKDGMNNGVSIIKDPDNDGRGVRSSNNAEWYRQYYARNGKAPNTQQLRDLAYDVLTGNSAYPVEGYTDAGNNVTPEDAAEIDKWNAQNKEQLDDIRDAIDTLKGMESTMRNMKPAALEVAKGLSDSGYRVFTWMDKMLSTASGEGAKRAGRMGAILFARHADRVADAMQASGVKDYTAETYMRDRIGINPGATYAEYIAQNNANVAAAAQYSQSMHDIRKSGAKSVVELLKRIYERKAKGLPENKLMFSSNAGVMFSEEQLVHAVNKHNLSTEDLADIEHSIGTIANAAISSWKDGEYKGVFNGTTVIGRVDGDKASYFVALEFSPNGSVWFKTAAKNNIDAINKKIEEGNAGMLSLSDDNAVSTSQASSISISSIREKLGVVNTFNQNVGGRAVSQFGSAKLQGAYLDAQSMEMAGNSYAEIEKATGWFKLPDGQWRYEIPDNIDKIDFKAFQEKKEANANAYAKEEKDADDAYAKLQRRYDGLSNKRTEEAKELYKKVAEAFLKLKAIIDKRSQMLAADMSIPLSQIYDNEALYVLYPDLKDLPVILKTDESTTGGYITGKADAIYINPMANKSFDHKETLLHELQHIIQRREGFARGGNSETGVDLWVQKLKQQYNAISDKREKIPFSRGISILVNLYDIKQRMTMGAGVDISDASKFSHVKGVNELFKKFDHEFNMINLAYQNAFGAHNRKEIDRLETASAKLKKKYSAALETVINDRVKELEAEKQHFLENTDAKAIKGVADYERYTKEMEAILESKSTSFEAYQNLHGEIEARDTARRGKEKGANSKANKTADRLQLYKNAIVSFNGKEVANVDTNIASYNQTAWVGSPSIFDHFDLGYVGTGEGNAVHGWGLYSAAQKSTAMRYRSKLTLASLDSAARITYNDKTIEEAPAEVQLALIAFASYNNKPVAAERVQEVYDDSLTAIKDELENMEAANKDASKLRELLSAMEKLDASKIRYVDSGALYEVDIPENDVLLDEDKPLNEQPPKVREAIFQYMKDNPDTYIVPKNADSLSLTPGRYFYEDVALNERRINGAEGNGQREASLTLNKYGIKGITYDGQQDGRCFVMFDDKAISIINRYNQEQGQQLELGSEKLHNAMQKWSEAIDNRDSLNRREFVDVMDTPLVMQLAGLPALPIKMKYDRFDHILKDHADSIGPEQLKALPAALANPLFIAKSKKNILVALDLLDKNGNTTVTFFSISKTGAAGKGTNLLLSVYGKDSAYGKDVAKSTDYKWFIDNFLDKSETMLYINKEKTTDWLASGGLKVPRGSSSISSLSTGSIPNENDLSKRQLEYPELYQNGPAVRGQSAIIENGKRIITLFESADESTFMHEMGHIALADLKELAALDGAPEQLKKDLKTVTEWGSWAEGSAKAFKGTSLEAEFSKRDKEIRKAIKEGFVERNGVTVTLDQLKEEWLQERFARGFEAYLRTGEAPTSGLKGVFRKFKAWLSAIYRDFAQLGGKPSVEVMQVMDRMIASQDEIDVQAHLQEIQSFEKLNGISILDNSTADMYKRWVQESKEEAKEKLLKTLIASYKKNIVDSREKYAAERTAAITSELQNKRCFAAEEAVKQSGGNESVVTLMGYSDVEQYHKELAENGGSLDAEVKRRVGEEMQQFDKGMPSQSDITEQAREALNSAGNRAEIVALELEGLRKRQAGLKAQDDRTAKRFADVEESLSGIKNEEIADRESKHVKALKHRILELKYAERWKEAERKLIDQMYNAKSKEAMSGLLQKIKEQAKDYKDKNKVLAEEAKSTAAIYKAMAQGKLATMSTAQSTNANIWLRKEQAAIRKSTNAMAKGNFDEALAAKKEQLLYAAMASQAYANKKIADSIVNRLIRQGKTVNNTKSSVKFGAKDRYVYQRMMYVIGLRQTAPSLPFNETATSLTQYFTEKTNAMEINGMPAEDIILMFEKGGMPEDMRGIDKSKIRSMYVEHLTLDQLQSCAAVMDSVYTMARDEDKFKSDTLKGMSIADVVDEICTSGWDNIKSRAAVRKRGADIERSLSDKVFDLSTKFTIKVETILKLMGKTADNAAIKYIYNPIDKAVSDETARKATATADLRKIFEAAYTKDERRDMTNKKNIELPNGVLWTKEQLLCAALNYGNKTNQARLLTSLDIKELQMLKLFENNLDAKDWTFVEGIWDYINSFWPEMAKTEEDVTGAPIKKVPAEPFAVTMKDGNYRIVKGGYYPIKFDPSKSTRAEEQEQDALLEANLSGLASFGFGLGMTKERSASANIDRELDLHFSVITKHTNDVLHIITHRKAVRDVWKIVTNNDFGAMVKGTYGDTTYMLVKQWAQDCWHEPAKASRLGDTEKYFKYVRQNANQAIMAYRASTALLNFANIAPMASELGAIDAAKAMMDFWATKNMKANIDFVTSKSSFIRNRAATMDRDLSEIIAMSNPAKVSRIDDVNKHSGDLLAWTDEFCSLPTWACVYRKTLNELLEQDSDYSKADAAAIQKADSVVRSIFASGSIKDMAAIQKGGEVNRLMTPFYSFFNTQLNALAYEFLKSRNTGSYTPFIRCVMYRVVLMTAIETLLRRWIKSWGGDDNDDFLLDYLNNIIGNTFTYIPFFGALAERTVKKAFGLENKFYGRASGTNLALSMHDRIDDLVNTSIGVYKGKKDFIDLGRDLSKAANVILPSTRLAGWWVGSDTFTDAWWTTLRYMDLGFDDNYARYLRDVVFDKRPNKKKIEQAKR